MLVPEEEAVSSVDVVLAAQCPLWPWDKESDIPLKTKKLAFDKFMLVRRLKEEEGILIKEMKQHWQSLCHFSRQLKEDLSSDSHPLMSTHEAYEGLCCILKSHLDATKKQMMEVQSVYRTLVTKGSVHHEEKYEDEDVDLSDIISDFDSDSDSEIIVADL